MDVQQFQSSSLMLLRLQRDMKEINNEPLQGIHVVTHETDITSMCLILSPLEGPFSGLSLHLTVSIPPSYPHNPPSVSIQTCVDHPNVIRNFICCDLLRQDTIRSPNAYNGGYTPGYLLKYVFLQLLSFFSADQVEQHHGGRKSVVEYPNQVIRDRVNSLYTDRKRDFWNKAKKAVKSYACMKCGFNLRFDAVGKSNFISPGYARGQINVDLPLLAVPDEYREGNQLIVFNILDSDCWFRVFELLSDRDILHLSRASPNVVGKIIHEKGVLVLRAQLVCFFLRKTFRESVLGVGVRQGHRSEWNIEAFDLLSDEAFSEHHVRTGVCGHRFTHFLPLALDDEHFSRALPILLRNLTAMHSLLWKWRTVFESQPFLGVLPKLMNQMIVNFMKVCDEGDLVRNSTVLRASEKALQGYCLLLHLLLNLANQYPDVRREAQHKISMFVNDPVKRYKRNTPDLGEFLAFLPLVADKHVDWCAFYSCFVKELLTRNVLWFLKNRPSLAYIEPKSYVSIFRLRKTFDESRTSLRLVMFQARFMIMVLKSGAQLWKRYGYPTEEMSASLFKLTQEIYSIEAGNDGSGWRSFFNVMQCPLSTMHNGKKPEQSFAVSWQSKVAKLLRRAVKDSLKQGYHEPSELDSHQLYCTRKNEEPECPWNPKQEHI